MATESAADTELSVTLSPPLSEWLEERATALGVDRETVLIQLLGMHRTAAEIDPEEFDALLSSVADSGELPAAVDRDEIDELERDVEAIDRELSDHVEDLRSRILQLKETVESRAPADHDHPEIDAVDDRLRDLSNDVERIDADLDEVATELDAIASDLVSVEDRTEIIEDRLHRLARVVLDLKRGAKQTAEKAENLERIRQLANRNGTTEADCGGCNKRLRIGLLTAAACPHCGTSFRDIVYPSALLRPLKRPTLTDEEPTEPTDEAKSDDE